MTEKDAKTREPEPIVLSELRDDIGVVTMNHPGKLNALSSQLVAGVLQAFDAFAGARVIILRALSGARVWSAGHDIAEIPVDGQDPITWNVPFEQLLHRVRGCPVPVIGMIEGSVWGGACDLAMTCDLLVGTPTASFAITPARLGLSYNTAGVSHFLAVLPLHITKEMLFTAQPLAAADAFRLGLLNRLVEPSELEEVTMRIARDIASRAPLAIRVLKKEIEKLTSGPSLSADDFEQIQNLRREAFRSADFKEGIRAFFEKRQPLFTGK